jgi:hypothetical protein
MSCHPWVTLTPEIIIALSPVTVSRQISGPTCRYSTLSAKLCQPGAESCCKVEEGASPDATGARTWACSLLHSTKRCPVKRQCNSRDPEQDHGTAPCSRWITIQRQSLPFARAGSQSSGRVSPLFALDHNPAPESPLCSRWITIQRQIPSLRLRWIPIQRRLHHRRRAHKINPQSARFVQPGAPGAHKK